MAMMFVDFSVKDTFTFVSSWCAMFWGDGSMNNLDGHTCELATRDEVLSDASLAKANL